MLTTDTTNLSFKVIVARNAIKLNGINTKKKKTRKINKIELKKHCN
jgi:hypothetical protein